ncbi:hypothetical protein LP316_09675 [Thalassotalea sp. LPB0316]|uniref:hypothetical protein n=1 Tax=Thalassotalea sp. LPB0316 TaxID=2769490 RepID=UPI0018685D33|nr:hypothetical protein [Thalassotalea sp. LPB0316]QOL24614.1 hypothetical protein LP316_09675 [Thalassotalea sp. LPB0316]
MVNSVSSTASLSSAYAYMPKSNNTAYRASDKSLPENGLATIAQQPETYTLANKALQYGLAKNKAQHTQNMIDAYTQKKSEPSHLITDLSIADLYKQAYKFKHSQFPLDIEQNLPVEVDKSTRMVPVVKNRSTKLVRAYEENKPSETSLFSIQV